MVTIRASFGSRENEGVRLPLPAVRSNASVTATNIVWPGSQQEKDLAGIIPQPPQPWRDYPDANKSTAAFVVLFFLVVWIAHMITPAYQPGTYNQPENKEKQKP